MSGGPCVQERVIQDRIDTVGANHRTRPLPCIRYPLVVDSGSIAVPELEIDERTFAMFEDICSISDAACVIGRGTSVVSTLDS